LYILAGRYQGLGLPRRYRREQNRQTENDNEYAHAFSMSVGRDSEITL
jgi:hypothetical protein